MDELNKAHPLPLSDATLAALPAGIDVPRYDRGALRPGIVHIGLGNFHRAHQAWYLHRLMQEGRAQDWAILGAGVRPNDADMRARLVAQDCLTTLIELAPGGISAEVTGAMVGFIEVAPGHGPLIAAMADPAIRIVSLTVTEGGYYTDPATGGLDTGHPDIVHDASHPNTPRSAFGAMVAALRRRKDAGHRPFTAMSCDNLRGNGAVLRAAVVGLARLTDPDLAAWIDAEGAFPNSMVDCIVPATGPAELQLARDLGIDDAAPVTHENFRQWVIEDDFCAGRPDWDAVGDTFSDDVHGYEAMKIRMLNAGHQVLANAGELLGLRTIADCMADPRVGPFFAKVLGEEILPHVSPVSDMAPADYLALISRRFANRAIQDTTRRVAFDGSSRHSGFIVPIIQDAIAAAAPVNGLALVEALWAHMCAGRREDGSAIEPNDPHWPSLAKAADAARSRPITWLEQHHIYGHLATHDAFAAAFADWHAALVTDGTRAVLESYLAR